MPDSLASLTVALSERYTIQRELGRGGMATVYLAEDLRHERQVAIKVLDPELAAMLGPERFLREITLTARLDHPHILPLLDSGDAEGFIYYVMPYVEGETLRDRLDRDKQLPVEEALQITRQVGDALGYAHSRGVLHRDIKPENILLGEGHARVADFGIARAVTAAGAEPLTGTGLAVGTPAYMSPEQAGGAQDLDGRSDLYSLGCVLYEMLAGEPPHTGPSAQAILAKRLSEPAPRVSVVRETVPAAVEAALHRALARIPADRFATAAELAQALRYRPEVAAQHRRRARVGLGVWLSAALVIAVAGLTAAMLVPNLTTSNPDPIRSLVVLPLDNLTDKSEQDYFVEGMHDSLTGALAQISSLRIISRSSAIRYKASDKSLAEIASELDVDAVVIGSVFRSGKTARIQVQLVSVQPERLLWSQSYEGSMSDALNLIARVSRNIAMEVQARLTPTEYERLTDRPEVNPEAYDTWLKASYHASRRTASDADLCIRYADRAISIDPRYAPAYQTLAECYNLLTFVSKVPAHETFPKAKRAASKALTLDGALAPAHATLGYALAHYDWDWAAAEQSYRRALQLNPGLDAVHGDMGWLLAWLGHFDEALMHVRTAERLNPLSVQAALRVAMVLNLARRHNEAIDVTRRALAMDPDFMFAYDRLHWAYDGKAMYSEALTAAEKAAELAGPQDVRRRAFLGYAYARAGQMGEARLVLNELLSLERDGYVPALAIAAIYVGLDELDSALSWIERGHERRDAGMVLLNTFSLWDPLRGHPRFQAVIRKMAFAP